jgi:hypothetical protein
MKYTLTTAIFFSFITCRSQNSQPCDDHYSKGHIYALSFDFANAYKEYGLEAYFYGDAKLLKSGKVSSSGNL